MALAMTRTNTKDVPVPQAVFIQMTTPRAFDTVRHALQGLGPVRASGRGTASDPEAYWFEVLFDAQKAGEGLRKRFLEVLEPFDVTLTKLMPVPVGTGPTMAKQLDLFGGA